MFMDVFLCLSNYGIIKQENKESKSYGGGINIFLLIFIIFHIFNEIRRNYHRRIY